ncbi:DNA ligase 1 [Sciurus carolinensis]|uniref:DNA ligase 1 n=1 Tax=Sciurus carolinensis TaxID=30640 RepID=A0AA41NIC5_SCICA|nr:DNA ligase 1 [Sciurus carolinensis]
MVLFLKPMLTHSTRGVSEVLKHFQEAVFTFEYKSCGLGPGKEIQLFQVLTTPKQEEVDASQIQVQVYLYAFDLIFLNGESLVCEPLSLCQQLLREHFVETKGEFVFATSLATKDTEKITEFLEQSVKDSCEGQMVKTLDVDATYESAKLAQAEEGLPGWRGRHPGPRVIGAYLGRGSGPAAMRNWKSTTRAYGALRPYVQADGAVDHDHWLDPNAVWEVKCVYLSLSPIYPAAPGLVDSEKGVSLRFPRFIRVREVRSEEATPSSQVACLYWKQSQIQNQQGAGSDSDPEDFY